MASNMENYYLSYHLQVHDAVPTYERLSLTRAMVPFHGEMRPLCRFESDETDFETFVRYHRETLLQCLMPTGVELKSWERTERHISSFNLIDLRLPPLPLQVEFNDGLVIINQVVGR